jgi:hypothetical protein
MLLLALALQVTPVAPIEKGTGLPPPGADEAAVLAPIQALTAAIAARDAAEVAAALPAEGSATVANEAPNGTRTIRQMPFSTLAGQFRPGPERYQERLGTPAIEIDGDIAMVWAPYAFLIDGKVHHCGVDHFGLARENGAWKIASLSWSARAIGCDAR